MDDINQKIEKLEKSIKIAKAFWLTVFSICLLIVFFAYQKALSNGHKIFLFYFSVSIVASMIITVTRYKSLSKPENDNQKEKYYKDLIDQVCWSLDMAPMIFFIPVYFGMAGILSAKYLAGLPIINWLSILTLSTWILSFLFYMKRRKFIFSEYKRIHGVKYLSIF